MSVPSTPEPQTIPVSKITRGLNLCDSRVQVFELVEGAQFLHAMRGRRPPHFNFSFG
jgi:hypothetical protein